MSDMKPSNHTASTSRPMEKAMIVSTENPSEHRPDSNAIRLYMMCDPCLVTDGPKVRSSPKGASLRLRLMP